MTLEETSAELWRFDKIEETIKPMLGRGILGGLHGVAPKPDSPASVLW
jgi:hypothetical protein